MIRKAAVAGQFYKGYPDSLKKSIEECFLHGIGPGKLPKNIERHGKKELIALISPHAGYIYSGPVACHGFLELWKDRDKAPDTIIIIGPNHHGGEPIAIMNSGAWETPLGNINIDEEIANEICNQSDIIQPDELSHRYEHSIEVQLPFLQYLYDSDFKFVPIALSFYDFQNCTIIGESIAKVIQEYENQDILLIASTDFTHFESHGAAKAKDMKAINAIEQLDAKLLFDTVRNNRISMCGVIAVTSIIIASNKLGAREAKLLKWASSGDITQDRSSVVGYGSLVILK